MPEVKAQLHFDKLLAGTSLSLSPSRLILSEMFIGNTERDEGGRCKKSFEFNATSVGHFSAGEVEMCQKSASMSLTEADYLRPG